MVKPTSSKKKVPPPSSTTPPFLNLLPADIILQIADQLHDQCAWSSTLQSDLLSFTKVSHRIGRLSSPVLFRFIFLTRLSERHKPDDRKLFHLVNLFRKKPELGWGVKKLGRG